MNNKIPLLSGKGDPLPLAMLVGLFQSFSIGYVTLGVVYFAADRFGADSAAIGLLAAAYTFTYALSCFTLNLVISRLKPYGAIMIGVSAQLLLAQVVIRAQSLGQVTAVFILFGLCTGFIWPPLMGWMSRGRDGSNLNRAMSAYNFSWSIPWMLSPFITGLLYERSQSLPFHFCSLFSLFVLMTLAVYLGVFKEVKLTAQSEHSLKKRAGRGEDRSTPLRFLTWINLFPSYLFMGLYGSIVPLFLRRAFDLPESQVGLVILVRALVTIMVFFAMGRTALWHFNRKLILVSTPVMAILIGLFIGSSALWHYVLWTVVAGIVVGYSYTNSMFHCLSGAVERQRRMNIHEIVLTASMLTGSLLGGIFLDRFGMNFIVLFVAAMMLATLPLQILADRLGAKKTGADNLGTG